MLCHLLCSFPSPLFNMLSPRPLSLFLHLTLSLPRVSWESKILENSSLWISWITWSNKVYIKDKLSSIKYQNIKSLIEIWVLFLIYRLFVTLAIKITSIKKIKINKELFLRMFGKFWTFVQKNNRKKSSSCTQ